MSDRPVPQINFDTTGQVRTSKSATGVDIVHFSLECRITEAVKAAKFTFPIALPKFAQVDHIHMHPFGATALTDGTSPVAVGIGVTDDPDEYALITVTDIDAVGENVTTIATAVAPSATAKTLFIHSANVSGEATGNIVCDYGIRITGRIIQPIVA